MIASIHVRNFKSLSDVTLPLGGITVLTGLNGMGKSTFIQSLLLLQQSYRNIPDRSIPFLLLNSHLVNIGTAKDALWEGAERTDKEEKERIAFEVVANGTSHSWAFEYDELADELVASATNSKGLPDHIGLFSHRFHYLSAERSGPRATYPISRSRVVEERAFGKDGGLAAFFLSEFGSEIVRNEQLRHPGAISNQLRHQVEAWLGEISPGTRIYTEPHRKLDLVSLEYAFGSPSGESNHYRATNVGFGMTYVLPVLLATLTAEQGALLIIENPEAHLHPKGQLKIGELLALSSLAGVQVVIETHSDHLLNGIRLAVHNGQLPPESVGIHFFEREDSEDFFRSKITSPHLDRTGRLDQWPENFFDESEKALRQLLRPPSGT